MKISIVVMMADKGVIGFDGAIPWDIDMNSGLFKFSTFDKPIIIGRKAFEARGELVQNSLNVVVSKTKFFNQINCITVCSPTEAINTLEGMKLKNKEVLVFGGESMYRAFLPLSSTIYMLRIHQSFEGDAFFEINPSIWKPTMFAPCVKNKDNPYRSEFIIYKRRLSKFPS